MCQGAISYATKLEIILFNIINLLYTLRCCVSPLYRALLREGACSLPSEGRAWKPKDEVGQSKDEIGDMRDEYRVV